MKKKTVWFFVVVLIVANIFFSATLTPAKKSNLKLQQLEARADEPGEIDPPGDEWPPTRRITNKSSLSAIIVSVF